MAQPKIKVSAIDVGSGPFNVVATDGSGNVVISGSYTGAGTGLTGTAASLNVGTAATWTTARTITIGLTGKSLNGSANVTWTLAELGAVDLTSAQSIAGVKTFTDRSVHEGAYTPSLQPTFSATPTFDCAQSNVFEPAALTGNVTSITMSNPVGGQTVQIRFLQDGTGGRTIAVPAGAKIDGTVETAANRVTWLIMTYSARASRWEGNWLVVPA